MRVVSSRQVKDYLLCEACEQRLRLRGEDWTMANCYRGKSSFGLREALFRCTASAVTSSGTVLYEANRVAGVDLPKLIYFGASIFWRAAAHEWRIGDRSIQVELGPYTERLRSYLLGNTFPEGACLCVRVSTLEEYARTFRAPWSATFNGYRGHAFMMLGLAFSLYVGKKIPASFMKVSTAPSGMIAVSREADSIDLHQLSSDLIRVEVSQYRKSLRKA